LRLKSQQTREWKNDGNFNFKFSLQKEKIRHLFFPCSVGFVFFLLFLIALPKFPKSDSRARFFQGNQNPVYFVTKNKEKKRDGNLISHPGNSVFPPPLFFFFSSGVVGPSKRKKKKRAPALRAGAPFSKNLNRKSEKK